MHGYIKFSSFFFKIMFDSLFPICRRHMSQDNCRYISDYPMKYYILSKIIIDDAHVAMLHYSMSICPITNDPNDPTSQVYTVNRRKSNVI